MGEIHSHNIERFRNTIINLEHLSSKKMLFTSTFRLLAWIYFMYEMNDNDESCLIDMSDKLINGMVSSITEMNEKRFLEWNDKEINNRSFFINDVKKSSKINETEKKDQNIYSNHQLLMILNEIDTTLNKMKKNICRSKMKKADVYLRFERRSRFKNIKKQLIRSIINSSNDQNNCFSCNLYNKEVLLHDDSYFNRQRNHEEESLTEDSGISSEEETNRFIDLLHNRKKRDIRFSESESRAMVEVVFEKSDLCIFNYKSFEKSVFKKNEDIFISSKEPAEKLESDVLKLYENGSLEYLSLVFTLFKSKRDYCGIFLLSKILLDLHEINKCLNSKNLDNFLKKMNSKLACFYREIDFVSIVSCSDHQFRVDLKKFKTKMGELMSQFYLIG